MIRKVQCVVFRKNGNDIEFLLLKTIEERGGFWQSVTGKVEPGESLCYAAKRELFEETCIEASELPCREIYSFSFSKNGQKYNETVFLFQVGMDQVVDTTRNVYPEHVEYRWLCADDAKSLLRFDEEKKAIEMALGSIS